MESSNRRRICSKGEFMKWACQNSLDRQKILPLRHFESTARLVWLVLLEMTLILIESTAAWFKSPRMSFRTHFIKCAVSEFVRQGGTCSAAKPLSALDGATPAPTLASLSLFWLLPIPFSKLSARLSDRNQAITISEKHDAYNWTGPEFLLWEAKTKVWRCALGHARTPELPRHVTGLIRARGASSPTESTKRFYNRAIEVTISVAFGTWKRLSLLPRFIGL